jgi:glycosyltransferase involved in cell wall biosynthesis
MHGSEQPRLTVLIVTYNHEAYIRQAVESVLMQKLSERYQVIVADDGSTDKTRTIIDEIFSGSLRAPPVRFLDSAVNRGITENYRRSFAACDTEYVAIIEGDDYWIHPGKLAAQIAFLDKHLECAAVSANYFVYDENACRFTARATINTEFSYIDARGLINDNLIGNFSTCMYRLAALKAIPDALYLGTAYDWGVNICVARNALLGFLHTPFSVYRIHDRGTWNGLRQNERLAAHLEVVDHYNKATDFVFDTEFKALARRLNRSLLEAGGDRPGGDRPWLPRIYAILLACVPPGIPWVLRLTGHAMKRFLLPPIIPIAIRKLRGRRP